MAGGSVILTDPTGMLSHYAAIDLTITLDLSCLVHARDETKWLEVKLLNLNYIHNHFTSDLK